MGFLSALGIAHGKKIIQGVTDAIVDFDPKTASDAQLRTMEESLDHVGLELAKIRTESAKEHADMVATQQRFDRMKAAGDALNTQWANETDPVKKASLEKSLNGLLTTLEGIKTELDQHTQYAADTDAQLAETEQVYKEKAEEIKNARETLNKAARDLEMAHLQQERANEQAERAAELAGLRNNNVDGLNAALSSMQRQTEAAKADAEAKRMKSDVLKHADAGGLDDPNVKAALASVDAAPSSQSFADRLAALGH